MVLNWPADAIILHIPHASTVLPSEVAFLLGQEELAYEVDAMTDHHTDQLFDLPGAHRCVFPVSRLVVDPERFIDDPMESVGMESSTLIPQMVTLLGLYLILIASHL